MLAAVSIAGVTGLLSFHKIGRAVATEATTFHPPHGPIVAPAELAAQGLRDVEIPIAEGRLRGWTVPSRNGAIVVFVHGSPGSRMDLVDEATALARAGYGVLLIDLPGHGMSDGKVTWGDSFCDATRAALDFALTQPGVDPSRVGLFAFSMGSAIGIDVAASDSRVAAIALSGAFTDLDKQIDYEFRSWAPLTAQAARVVARRGGLRFDNRRPQDRIPQIGRRPALFIAGTDDRTVPAAMTKALYEGATGPKEFVLVQGAGHGHYARQGGPDYQSRVVRFFDAALGPARAQ